MINKVVLPERHHIFEVSTDINDIVTPIKNKFKLRSFVYIRTYFDSSCFILTDYPQMIQHHLKSGYCVPAPVYIPEDKTQFYNFIPLGINNEFRQARYDHTNLFHIGESLDVVYKQETYTEVFTINVPLETTLDPASLYLNNKDHFDNFFKDFRSGAARIFREVDHCRFILPNTMNGIRLPTNECKDEEIQHYPDIKTFATKPVSRREMETLIYLMRGGTAKTIAKNMGNLSCRTIEAYIDSLKNKLGCFTKTQLLEKIWKSDLPYKYIRHLKFGEAISL